MEIKFKDEIHKTFFERCLKKASVSKGDTYTRAFFYTLGILPETRAHIESFWDFKENCIKLEGMNGPWQTSGSLNISRLAFNLYNGFRFVGDTWDTLSSDTNGYFTPYELFANSEAFYMLEAIKVRYPEYTNPDKIDVCELLAQGLVPAT